MVVARLKLCSMCPAGAGSARCSPVVVIGVRLGARPLPRRAPQQRQHDERERAHDDDEEQNADHSVDHMQTQPFRDQRRLVLTFDLDRDIDAHDDVARLALRHLRRA